LEVSGLEIDWTIKPSEILAWIGALAIAYKFVYGQGGSSTTNQATLEKLTKELIEMKTEIKSIGEVLKKVALQEMQIRMMTEKYDEQINRLTKWYDELRRGNGWMTRNKRKDIEGEWP
jgi:hypothetical protein